ncbi:hypothetical protein LOH54_04025 [Sulfurimonas sp. HSL-3221]|uniref:hypothetical protein n=1 Tax=Sulfurimonadaceae TaxID=2771471 RepID=UPI001E3AE978|nr:hypothetical protein [Sulfurimonas sp. HSL-3221]UFS63300.1 hypothetical protein LOH54_04025 [Sulfurimonas sp. HSL-3221]
MEFKPHSQAQLKALRVTAGAAYMIEYLNKDYFNGEETVERGKGTAVVTAQGIFFNVQDPYGMVKLVMQARVIARS